MIDDILGYIVTRSRPKELIEGEYGTINATIRVPTVIVESIKNMVLLYSKENKWEAVTDGIMSLLFFDGLMKTIEEWVESGGAKNWAERLAKDLATLTEMQEQTERRKRKDG